MGRTAAPVKPLPSQMVEPRRQELAALTRGELEGVYRALPNRTASPRVTLSDEALRDLIVWVELERVTRAVVAKA